MPAKDEYIVVLDFLPKGKATDLKPEPVVQGIGDKYFNLLEVVLKEGIEVKPGDKIYIGSGKRDIVKYIRSRIRYEDLTSVSKDNLENILYKIVEENEKRFIKIFNLAGPITTRRHSLELLPGIGKKHLWQILEERRNKPFESFKDLQERVEMLPDPKRMIVKRIIEELQGKDKYRLFVGVRF